MTNLIEEPLVFFKKFTYRYSEFTINTGVESGNCYIKSGKKTLVLINDDDKKENQTTFKIYFDNEFIFEEIFNLDHPYHVEAHFKKHLILSITDEEMESLINYEGLKGSRVNIQGNHNFRYYIKNIDTEQTIIVTLVRNHIDLNDFFTNYFDDNDSIYIDNDFIEKESKSLNVILDYSCFSSINLFKSLINNNFFFQVAYTNGDLLKYFCYDSKNKKLSIFDIDSDSDVVNLVEFNKSFEDSMNFSLNMILKMVLHNIHKTMKDIDISNITFENLDDLLDVLEMVEV